MPANVETMAYRYASDADIPWHGLGNRIEQGISVDNMLTAAGLNWGVKTAPVKFYPKGEKTARTVTSRNVLYRDDTNAVLDIVGPQYVPTQNVQVLDFFREYVEAGDMHLETAGSLDGGKYIWALAKMGDGFTLPGKDDVQGHLLLMNPHLYGKGLIAKFCAIRVVCWNTLTMALQEAGPSIQLWHTREFDEDRQQEAKARLGIARTALAAFKHNATLLTKLRLDPIDATKIIAKVLNTPTDRPLDDQPPTVKRIITLWQGEGKGSTLASSEGTAWGLLNGLTEYFDHEYGKTVNARMRNAWLGRGEVTKRRLMTELVGMTTGSN